MKLASYLYDHELHVGAVVDNDVINAGEEYSGRHGMLNFLHAGEAGIQELQQRIDSNQSSISLEDVDLQAPISRPGKVFGVSLNYDDHIAETGREKPEFPTFFNKQTSCVIGPEDPIHRPKVSEKLDYEGELGVVIGKYCRHVSSNDVKKVIAGYTIVNDVSVRDWQIRSHTWTLGKSFDTHGPTGPWIVTPDEIGDPHNLSIKTWVNDEERQNFNTEQMIFNCYYLIEYLSMVMTLEPGDIIATGTGSGVGVKMKPRGYMHPGDKVSIEIEKIGRLTNPVIQEPKETSFIDV